MKLAASPLVRYFRNAQAAEVSSTGSLLMKEAFIIYTRLHFIELCCHIIHESGRNKLAYIQ